LVVKNLGSSWPLALRVEARCHEEPKFFTTPFFSYFFDSIARRAAKLELNYMFLRVVEVKFGPFFF
jgi:hypothetical protein